MSSACRWRVLNPELDGPDFVRCGREADGWGLCAEHNAEWERQRQTTCIGCGTTFNKRYRRPDGRGYCSEECRHHVAMERQRERRAAAHEPPADRPCERCGEQFTPTRSDARFCSGRCRVAKHRAAQQG